MTDNLTPLDVLRRDGWCKDSLHDDKGQHCMLGAFGVAYGRIDAEWLAAFSACNDIIGEQFPERSEFPCVVFFNDHPATTFADVEMVLEKAQLRLDERVA